MILACLATIMINQSSEAWNKHDRKILESASKRCVVKFPDSPCLVRFVKRAPRTYWAICGAES